MASSQLDLQALRQQLQRLPTPAPAAVPLNMGGGMQPLPVPQMPAVVGAPPPPTPASNSTNQLLTAQAKYSDMQAKGAGVDQIHNGVGRTLAKIGSGVYSALLPGFAQQTPGTELHHQMLMGQQQGQINEAQKNLQGEAQTKLMDAQPELKQMGLENQMLKTQGLLGHYDDQAHHWDNQSDEQMRDHGYKRGPDGKPIPLTYQELPEHLQAVEDLKHAQAEQADATAAMNKAKNDPSSPSFLIAKQRADTALGMMKVAVQRVALAGQNTEMRREITNASLHGTDNSGNPLAGAAQIEGDNGQLQTIGTKFAPTAIKQQKTVTSFNDLSGSVQHLRQAIKAYEAEGGDMSDARLAAAAADPHSTLGKVINGKLITGGLSPTAIQLLNAQRQTMEQAGILRSTTGGTSSEAGAQRILEVVPQFGRDSNKSAYNKLDEQEVTLKRLAPGQTRVHGGASVKNSSAGSKADPLGIR